MYSAGFLSSSLVFQPIRPFKPFLLRCPTLARPSIPLCSAEPEPPRRSSGSGSGRGRANPPMDSGAEAPGGRGARRHSHRTSRRSSIKKSLAQEQVVFTTPVAEDPVVAIIGGGVSGLVCALTLEERGIRSTVFDTGVHGLGGRMATRIISPKPLVFDHAAQFFTVSDSRFRKLVDGWLEKGLIQEWKGLLVELEAGGHCVPVPYTTKRYVGTNGMRPLMDSIICQSKLVNIVRPCWVSKLEPFNGTWRLTERDEYHGQFDAIVIAHNGKCANRLLSSSGLPLLTKQMKTLELSSIWALLAAFDDPLPIPTIGAFRSFDGAFVKGVNSLSWMGNNTSKLFPLESGKPHCWTFFSTAAYGKQNKVPQENIPNATAERVTNEMLEGVESALGLSKGSLEKPFYTRVQLWGAALPTNTPAVACIFDPRGRAGICGDWLLGSSVEAAALSGMALAHHMADYFKSGGTRSDEFAIGLNSTFQAIAGHDIGQFPGLEYEKQVEPQACTAL
ncbi:renalase-like [Zingiber officinale]|uniref:renalase-like n=1 Tax=Zingiber officinale TaxID=94328 RepID=UPI001C4A8143|nr:renalase-like [Zingiber officinale]